MRIRTFRYHNYNIIRVAHPHYPVTVNGRRCCKPAGSDFSLFVDEIGTEVPGFQNRMSINK
ncbi:MAG: hypothetical protein WAO79_09710 [Methanosarcina flavescens]